MANRLQIKRNIYGSAGAPAANSLLTGELAWDGASEKLYIGKQTNNQGDGSGGLAATDVTVKNLNDIIVADVPIATVSAVGTIKPSSDDFGITPAGLLTLATTSTAAELNILDGATVTTAELNILDGVTSTAAELNLVDGITPGTASASKAVILDSNKDLSGIRHLIVAGDLTVQGDLTSLQTSTLDVEDINITVAKGATDSNTANGAGLTVDGAGATFTYTHSGTKWNMNKSLDIVGTLEVTGGITNTTLDFGTYS